MNGVGVKCTETHPVRGALTLRVFCVATDNQFRMSILERLEQMERRMAEMAARDLNQHHQHHHQQRGNQLATPPPPPLPEDVDQVRI